MITGYHRTASVQFAINGTNQTATINDLPYLWIPAKHGSAEQAGILRQAIGHERTYNLRTVFTSLWPHRRTAHRWPRP
jgi:hypothetical protein